MAIIKWQALDIDGNVIDEWTGPQKASRIGTMWNGSMVDSIVEVIPKTQQQITNKKFAGIRSACENTDNDTLEKLKAAIVEALT